MRGIGRVRWQSPCAPGHLRARAVSGGAARARGTGGAAVGALAGATPALQRLLIVSSRELDATITEILGEAVRKVGAERGGVLLFGGKGSAQLDRSWGVPRARAQSFSTLRAPWTTAEVMARRPVIFTSPRELPSKAAVDLEELRANGVRSGMLVPLGSERGPVIGWAGFVTVTKERSWSPEDVAAALDYGFLLAAGLLRLRVERERERERDLLQSTVDALSDHIAIVDRVGIIVAVNRAWRRYADENGLRMPHHAVGASYVAVCDAARAACEDAAPVADAIRALARGHAEEYHREYACRAPQQTRWFRLRMTRFGKGEATRLVIAHEDVTELKDAEKRLRQLTRELLAAQDDERRRIARELHDGAAQNVFATSLELARLRARAADVDAARVLQECEALCREALKQLRTVSYVLHPLHLDERGLGPALRWYVPGFSRRSGIAASCRIGAVGRLDPALELALFRVLQEALANVQHHSRARSVHVALSSRDGEIVLSVRDDGRGGAPRPGEPGIGIGIVGMRERLEHFGGELEIVSGRRGTEVRARVPATWRASGTRDHRSRRDATRDGSRGERTGRAPASRRH